MESALQAIAANVKALREKKNFSIVKLAELAKVNWKTIKRLEDERGSPSWATVQLIAAALEVDPFDLSRPKFSKK